MRCVLGVENTDSQLLHNRVASAAGDLAADCAKWLLTLVSASGVAIA